MALQPSVQFQHILGNPTAPHTLEIFIDYVCPFSAKISRSVEAILRPKISTGGKYDGKVKVIIRLHPQPWHGSSTFTHETALAVGRVDPSVFWKFSLALLEKQGDFYDIPVSTKTPTEIRKDLVAIAKPYLGADKVPTLEDLLKYKGSPNGGIAVTDDLKYNIKYSRANGIHVSPTALWDGLIANEVSSSFGEKEWSEFLENRVTA